MYRDICDEIQVYNVISSIKFKTVVSSGPWLVIDLENRVLGRKKSTNKPRKTKETRQVPIVGYLPRSTTDQVPHISLIHDGDIGTKHVKLQHTNYQKAEENFYSQKTTNAKRISLYCRSNPTNDFIQKSLLPASSWVTR